MAQALPATMGDGMPDHVPTLTVLCCADGQKRGGPLQHRFEQ